MKLFCDFDGVINRFALPANVPAMEGSFDDNKKTRISVDEYGLRNNYTIRYSRRVVSFFKDLIEAHPDTFIWVTSWANHTHKLDRLLGVPPQEWLNIYEYFAYENNRRKHLALDEYFKNNTDSVSAYIWLDDEATQGYANVDASGNTVEPLSKISDLPSLVIQTDDRYGLVEKHLTQISEFLKIHS